MDGQQGRICTLHKSRPLRMVAFICFTIYDRSYYIDMFYQTHC